MSELSDEQTKNMVNRFLSWKLPKDFNPDAGIKFTPPQSTAPHWWPVGTNLLTATQAEEMIRYITDSAHPQSPTPKDESVKGARDMLANKMFVWDYKDLSDTGQAQVDSVLANLQVHISAIITNKRHGQDGT